MPLRPRVNDKLIGHSSNVAIRAVKAIVSANRLIFVHIHFTICGVEPKLIVTVDKLIQTNSDRLNWSYCSAIASYFMLTTITSNKHTAFDSPAFYNFIILLTSSQHYRPHSVLNLSFWNLQTPWPDWWYSKHTLIFLSTVLYFTPALHWFVSVGFTQQLPPAVFYVVLLSKDLMFLTARLWEGLGWTGGELERCVFASPPPPYQEKGFIVHHRV